MTSCTNWLSRYQGHRSGRRLYRFVRFTTWRGSSMRGKLVLIITFSSFVISSTILLSTDCSLKESTLMSLAHYITLSAQAHHDASYEGCVPV